MPPISINIFLSSLNFWHIIVVKLLPQKISLIFWGTEHCEELWCKNTIKHKAASKIHKNKGNNNTDKKIILMRDNWVQTHPTIHI